MERGRKGPRIIQVPVDKVITDIWFPTREDLGDLVTLAKQLRSKGDVIVPIKVRNTGKGVFELVWGKRRLEAAKLAGLKKISAIVEDRLSDEELLIQHCLENLHRLDKDPIEEASLFKQMKNLLHKSYEELAHMLGLPTDYIYNRVELLELHPEVIKRYQAIRSATKDVVGLYHLRLLLAVKDHRMQLRLLNEIAEKRLTVRELAQLIENIKAARKLSTPLKIRGDKKIYDLSYPIVVEGSGNLYPQITGFDQNIYNWEICKQLKITHKDTHIDLPRFVKPTGKTIKSYPLDKFAGRGIVINVNKRPMEPIRIEDLENESFSIRKDNIIIINTGWWRYRNDQKYLEHPFLTEEAAEWIAKKKVKIVCMDTPSPDKPLVKRRMVDDRPVHNILLEKDVLIVENLRCSDISIKPLNIYVVPLYFSDLSEIPVKVMATTK
jgi:ParB family chromosome partitioning protein